MPATIVDINRHPVPLPEFMVLDASMLLSLRTVLMPGGGRAHHRMAARFLQRIRPAALSGTVKLLLPLLAFEECYFKLCYWIIEPIAQAAGARYWTAYCKSSPAVFANAIPHLQSFYRMLSAFPIEITEPEDIAIYPKGRETSLSTRMGEFINRFAVLPKDATILAEAERLGVFTVATLDSDWRRADGFTVFAPP